jgi:hypothetical protein
MESLTLVVNVREGRLSPTPAQQAALDSYLRTREGKGVSLKLARPKSTRTIEQNKLYWGTYLTAIAQHTGHTTEDVHEFVKEVLLPRRFVRIGEKEVEVKKTTTDLSVKEFSEFLERVAAWAAQELGVLIPGNEALV